MAKVRLTPARIRDFKCPPERAQAFLWDSLAPGLGVRVTPAKPGSVRISKPTYFFQAAYQGKSDVRVTIGRVGAWSIDDARAKAREIQRQIDDGRDPRIVKAETVAADVAERTSSKAEALTVGEVWPLYLKEGRPKRRAAWKPRYFSDLCKMAAPGGEAKKRGPGKTRPGPLYPLMALRLVDVDEDSLKSWFDAESRTSEHQAARALMMFRGFLRWCAGRKEYRDLADREAGRAAAITEALPGNSRRTDCLEAAQLPGWFAGTDRIGNPIAATYLKGLLLTGARREELAALKWADIDFRWKKLVIADKVDATRTIPLTPYLAQQLGALPRINEFVFASKSKSGRIMEPRSTHAKVLRDAGIEGLTIHGLRRSFSLLGEAAGAPAGAIAQVMGHKPSATAEGYRPRRIDDLRPYLAQIEAYILGLAGVAFVPEVEPGKLRAVV